MTGFLTKLE